MDTSPALSTPDAAFRFQRIHEFVHQRGCPTLFAVLRLQADDPPEVVAGVLDETMAWARRSLRGPEAEVARWLLFNEMMMVSAMLERRAEYLAEARCVSDTPPACPPQPLVITLFPSPRQEPQRRTRPAPILADPSPVLVALPLLLVALLLGGVMVVVVPQVASALQPSPAPVTRLTVQADPLAGAVYINDIQRGTDGYADFNGTLPAGEPLRVRVEAPGFAAWEETVTLQPDAPRVLAASLTLLEPAPFQPASGLVRGELPAEFWQQLAAREGALVDCFAPLPVGQTAVANIKGYTTTDGLITEINLTGAPLTADFERCIQRQLQAIALPPAVHDYATFRHSLQVVGAPRTQ